MKKLKLGVIFGGMSTEHDVSVVSGTSVVQNLNKEKYEIFPIYIDLAGKWYLVTKPVTEIKVLTIGEPIENLTPIENVVTYLQGLDVVFPVLHGLYGEDGTIQGLLELLKVKYVGCKVLCSSLCMDKIYAKAIFEKANILQANSVFLKKQGENQFVFVNKVFDETSVTLEQAAEKVQETLGLPVFVKPSNSGSSVGVKKATNFKELQEAILYASQFDTKILIEEEIVGREVECAVLGLKQVRVSNVGEILSAENFYTFDAKYKNQESKVVIPAEIPEETRKQIQNYAIKAFKAVDGTGLARIDFFIKKSNGKVYLNEINTMPGFTQISMYPKLWEEAGLSYEQLLDEIIQLAV